jgi:hypothetical protein
MGPDDGSQESVLCYYLISHLEKTSDSYEWTVLPVEHMEAALIGRRAMAT